MGGETLVTLAQSVHARAMELFEEIEMLLQDRTLILELPQDEIDDFLSHDEVRDTLQDVRNSINVLSQAGKGNLEFTRDERTELAGFYFNLNNFLNCLHSSKPELGQVFYKLKRLNEASERDRTQELLQTPCLSSEEHLFLAGIEGDVEEMEFRQRQLSPKSLALKSILETVGSLKELLQESRVLEKILDTLDQKSEWTAKPEADEHVVPYCSFLVRGDYFSSPEIAVALCNTLETMEAIAAAIQKKGVKEVDISEIAPELCSRIETAGRGGKDLAKRLCFFERDALIKAGFAPLSYQRSAQLLKSEPLLEALLYDKELPRERGR